VLLIEDAVYCATAAVFSTLVIGSKCSAKVYALEADLLARGLFESDCEKGIECVDYEGFVALVGQNNPIRSWL
jgi:sulfur relay protein TusB/DsrH